MSSKNRDEKTRELLRTFSKMHFLIEFLGNVFLIPKKAPKLCWHGDKDDRGSCVSVQVQADQTMSTL